MPALKKKVRQAKQQRAFGTSSFDSGLANSLSELLIDSRMYPKKYLQKKKTSLMNSHAASA